MMEQVLLDLLFMGIDYLVLLYDLHHLTIQLQIFLLEMFLQHIFLHRQLL